MSGDSWTHRMARPLVRRLIATRVRPNHLTTARLLTGLAACVCFALATRSGMVVGGFLWLLSAFLDRADGELARLGSLSSPGGHLFDYYSDIFVNALFFASIGLGLRHGWLGAWSVPLGLVSAVSVLLGSIFSEWVEERSPPDTKAYSGKWGFDPDDALYLMAPLAWLGWLGPLLLGASIGATGVMIVTGFRLRQLVLRQAYPDGSVGARPRQNARAKKAEWLH